MNNLLKIDLRDEVPSHVSFQNSKVEPSPTFLLKTFSMLMLTTDNDFLRPIIVVQGLQERRVVGCEIAVNLLWFP